MAIKQDLEGGFASDGPRRRTADRVGIARSVAAVEGARRLLDAVLVRNAQRLDPVRYHVQVGDVPDPDWQVHRVSLTEVFGGAYDLVIEVLTDPDGTDPERALGASAVLDIERRDRRRSVAGIVAGVDCLGLERDRLRLRLHVVPAFGLLGRTPTSRVFQGASVPEILAAVLDPGLARHGREVAYRLVRHDYAARDCCVQYRESDLEFVCRLMAEEGIGFYFATDEVEGRERMIVIDDVDALPAAPLLSDEPVPIILARPDAALVESLRGLDWCRHEALAPGRGGQYGRGRSNVTGFAAGSSFVLGEHELDELALRRFVITRVEHAGECPEPGLDAPAEAPRYGNRFECIPAADALRPAAAVAKPRVWGPHTAVVIGPPGEAIHVDAHGRIRVAFPWHRSGHGPDTWSCWVPVAQSSTEHGDHRGLLPQVGTEVVVSFIEGDPDRPIVTGCVHGAGSTRPR